jgi:hypothetical protein
MQFVFLLLKKVAEGGEANKAAKDAVRNMVCKRVASVA